MTTGERQDALRGFSVFSRLLGLAYIASPEGSREESRLEVALADFIGSADRVAELLDLLPREVGEGVDDYSVRFAFPGGEASSHA